MDKPFLKGKTKNGLNKFIKKVFVPDDPFFSPVSFMDVKAEKFLRARGCFSIFSTWRNALPRKLAGKP